MNAEFYEALKLIEREKEIPFDSLLRCLEVALAKAYERSLNIEDDQVTLKVEQTSSKGGSPFRISRVSRVSEYVDNPHTQISLADAREISPKANYGDRVPVVLTDREVDRMGGRIASQVARQVLMQEIREAERNKVYDEYVDRVGDVISGTISRRDRGDLVVQLGNQLGKMEAYLPGLEQTRGEQYRFHDRMKFFVVDVRKAGKGPRGPQIIVSRSHPSLLRRLFELEVPEIESGHVIIKSVARDPGQRSKIAVAAKDDRYDPVGSCVGHRGQRVQAVVDELRNEKVDIVRWSPDQRQFIIESLSPAKVVEVRLDEINKAALVIVQDIHLSLAIGKEGQNVRLAAKLTGWRIDIRSESQLHAGDLPEFMESVAPLEEPDYEEEDIYDTKKIADLPDDDDEEENDQDDEIYAEEVIELTPIIDAEVETIDDAAADEDDVVTLEDVVLEDVDDSIIDLSGFDDDEDED